MPRINDGYGGNYYQPPKKTTTTSKPTAPKPTTPPKPTAPPTTWEQQSYWERKAEQTRLEQEKYLQQMEAELRKQWLAANKPSPVSSFFGGLGQAAQQFFQNTFMAPFTGQYYTPPETTNQYAYNPAFQSQLSQSALAKSLAAAQPRNQTLMELVAKGYNIPNYVVPAPQTPAKQTYGGQNVRRWWTNTMEQQGAAGFALNANERPIQPYTGQTWGEAYLPDYGFGGWGYGGGWGGGGSGGGGSGGGGSYDYTSNPFYRNAEATRKPSYYETYLTWRVK